MDIEKVWDCTLHIPFSRLLALPQTVDRQQTHTEKLYRYPHKRDRYMLPMQALPALILLSISEFCENLLKEDNSNNTFSDVMSQLFGSIFRLQNYEKQQYISRGMLKLVWFSLRYISILNQTYKYMPGKREMPLSIFLFTSLHSYQRKGKNKAKEQN